MTCSAGIIQSIEQAGIRILEQQEYDDIDVCRLTESLAAGGGRVDRGHCGGKVIDVAKYIGFLNGLPYISVPTSPSNDGFQLRLFTDRRPSAVGPQDALWYYCRY